MFSEHLDEKLKFGGENPINKLPSRIIDTPEKKKEFAITNNVYFFFYDVH